jgi:hypothetical protein
MRFIVTKKPADLQVSTISVTAEAAKSNRTNSHGHDESQIDKTPFSAKSAALPPIILHPIQNLARKIVDIFKPTRDIPCECRNTNSNEADTSNSPPRSQTPPGLVRYREERAEALLKGWRHFDVEDLEPLDH